MHSLLLLVIVLFVCLYKEVICLHPSSFHFRATKACRYSYRLFDDSKAISPHVYQVPMKVMVFMDGTWLYYSLLKGRDDCPVRTRFGDSKDSGR